MRCMIHLMNKMINHGGSSGEGPIGQGGGGGVEGFLRLPDP